MPDMTITIYKPNLGKKQFNILNIFFFKSCIWETKNLSTDADSSQKNPASKTTFSKKQTFFRAAILHPL